MSSLSSFGTDFWGSLVAPSVSVPLSVLSLVWVGSVCDCCHAPGPSDLLLAVLLPHWELPRFLFGVGTMLLGAFMISFLVLGALGMKVAMVSAFWSLRLSLGLSSVCFNCAVVKVSTRG